MILRLHVSNFAIIEDITVDFNDKMTVLTGQTGAGKSLIIDSISLLLGQRADTDMIRFNASKAYICGVFSKNENLNEIFSEYSIPLLDEITIEREISEKKSGIWVNKVSINLNTLKKIGFKLGDIHAQADVYRLINPDNYLNIIDKFGYKTINNLKNEFEQENYLYEESVDKYNYALLESTKAKEKIEELNLQFLELEKYNLRENELNELEEQIVKLSNYDNIFSNLKETYDLVNNEYFNVDNIYKAASNLEKIKGFDQKFDEYFKVFNNSYYDLDDALSSIKKELENMDFNPETLDKAITRSNELKNLEKKYQKTIEELIEYKDKIKFEIDLFTNYDDVIKKLSEKCINLLNKVKKCYNNLNKERKNVGLILQKNLLDQCESLDLHDVKFEIVFKEDELKLYQKITKPIEVDFMISLNYGEPVKPLHKIASGGELSRIMLGFKSILAKNENLGLIVFDEIDSGISGITASKIAKKIKDISKSTQVLCITHLPHVAAIADYQINIYKLMENNRTKTYIKLLNEEERLKEIAVMISGGEITKGALEGAKELLNK